MVKKMQKKMKWKMKKKIIGLMSILCCFAVVACGKTESKDKEVQEPTIKDVSVKDIQSAVKEVYGEDYVPSAMEIDGQTMEAIYGIKEEWCEEFLIEIPMISVSIDTFMVFKANADNKENVLNAVKEYQATLKEDTFQYPANLSKIQASKVVDYGDYVFFLMLGQAPKDVMETGDTPKIIAAYEELNQQGVDAIEKILFP